MSEKEHFLSSEDMFEEESRAVAWVEAFLQTPKEQRDRFIFFEKEDAALGVDSEGYFAHEGGDGTDIKAYEKVLIMRLFEDYQFQFEQTGILDASSFYVHVDSWLVAMDEKLGKMLWNKGSRIRDITANIDLQKITDYARGEFQEACEAVAISFGEDPVALDYQEVWGKLLNVSEGAYNIGQAGKNDTIE